MSVPLTYIGSLIGRHFAKYDEIPCRVHTIPRPIPPKPWYLENYFVILASGIVPFGSIFIELHTILSSFWGYKPYYLYGFLLLSFIVLICVTGCISIVGTYLMMNMEDYRW
jgi:transmembrane 9 superfamily protein 3